MDNIEPLNVSIKKAVVNGSIYEIIEKEEYLATDPEKLIGNVAVRTKVNGHNIVLPVRGRYTEGTTIPGIYRESNCPLIFTVKPQDHNISQYEPRKIVDFNNKDSMKELLEKEEILTRMAEPWITSPDNVTIFPISENDQPEMRALKLALNAKHIDFDKYAPRFGSNFPNDKRQLKNPSATLNIIKRFCDNCDLDCEIVLRDKSPGVPNPMNTEIRVSLTDVTNEDQN